ncbi:membrane protein insertase YidC [bacterium]|nr:membrane protein insertase YidC [bacterium]
MFASLWNALLFHPFLNLLTVLYRVLGDNLGWAVIVIAILIRILLAPAMRSQMEMSKKLASLRPKLEKLQKEFANNQQKLAEEQMKLYRESGYNPLGCFASFLPQILVLYAMIQVINVVTHNTFDGLYPFVKEWVFGSSAPSMSTAFYFIDLTQTYTALIEGGNYFARKALPYLILSVTVGVVQYFSTKFMQIMQGQSAIKPAKDGEKTPEQMQMEMLNSMNVMFPALTIFISLSTPAVLGLYWLIQSVMLVVQYLFIDRVKFVSALKQTFWIKN